jgi:hypothetical protein
MLKRTLIATASAAALLAVALAPNGAAAQQVCAERVGVLKHLDKTHHEAPQALGITSSGQVVELLVSDKGSWTLIVTAPSGVACLIAAGDNWETMERLASNKPAA